MYSEEYVPPDTDKYLDVLIVEERAGHIVQAHYEAVGRGEWSGETLRETLETNDPQLFHAMQYIAEGYGIEDEEAKALYDGFTLAYTALVAQAELKDVTLPELEEHTIAGYLYGLAELEVNDVDYVNAILSRMKDINPVLVDCLYQYFLNHPTISSDAASACNVGFALAHDIIAQQVNASEIVRSRSADVN
jgi:hypothetical protein